MDTHNTRLPDHARSEHDRTRQAKPGVFRNLIRQFEDRFPEVFLREDALLLKSYAFVSLGLTLLHLAFKVSLLASQPGSDPLYLASTLICLANVILSLVLLYRGHVYFAGVALIGTLMWLIIDPAFLDGRGLRTPILVFYIVVILIADFLFGLRVGGFFTLTGVIGLWVLFFLQTLGHIKGLQFVAGPPIFNNALFYTVVFIYVHLFDRSYIRRNRQIVTEVEQGQLKLLESEKRRAAEQQSRLLMAEMHDGIGGTLVSLKLMLSNASPDMESVRNTVDRCLNDLRLTVVAVDPEQPDLATLLAIMRLEYKNLLESRNIQLIWDVDEQLVELEMPVSTRLHMVRVVQEAMTNTLKHADAGQITLQARLLGTDGLDITILDNGRAQSTQDPTETDKPPTISSKSGGYGLRSMQLRAEQGGFSVSAGPRTEADGYRVCIRWIKN